MENMEIGGGGGNWRKRTYFRRVLRVVCLIMQHCKMGARMEISSWKGLPNPLPWSKCRGNVLLPKILNVS